MTDVWEEVAALVRERDEARAAKDFATADRIRDRLAQLGYTVRDTPSGGIAEPQARFERVDPSVLPDRLAEPPSRMFSIHVTYEGFRDDLTRFIDALARHCAGCDYEIVVTEQGSDDGAWLQDLAGDTVRVIHFDRDPGWAAGRNAAIATSRGRIIVVADLSVEATGDLLTPIQVALQDSDVGIAGPWGLVTNDLRGFDEAPGPLVDAIQGYFLGVRRDTAASVRFDEKFKWYRHADIDLSFQIRARGLAAVTTAAPAVRHAHRAWEALDDDQRAKRSKRNFYRFLDRFKDRTDLIQARKG